MCWGINLTTPSQIFFFISVFFSFQFYGKSLNIVYRNIFYVIFYFRSSFYLFCRKLLRGRFDVYTSIHIYSHTYGTNIYILFIYFSYLIIMYNHKKVLIISYNFRLQVEKQFVCGGGAAFKVNKFKRLFNM